MVRRERRPAARPSTSRLRTGGPRRRHVALPTDGKTAAEERTAGSRSTHRYGRRHGRQKRQDGKRTRRQRKERLGDGRRHRWEKEGSIPGAADPRRDGGRTRASPLLSLAVPAPMVAHTTAGWSSLVAHRAHNPKVAGSNPAPAIAGPVAKATGPLVFRERRRETSAAFSLFRTGFAGVRSPRRWPRESLLSAPR